MQSQVAWNRFMENIDHNKNEEIPDCYKKQFKTKDEYIFPRDKRFQPIVVRVHSDEKLRQQRKWDKECKMFLLWVMIKFFQTKNKLQVDPNNQEWEELSQILNIEKSLIKARWITLINPKQKSQNWTTNEDEIIRESMQQRLHKHIWTQIAVRLYETNICPCARTPKQVRERWINYLNPYIKKDHWLMSEDIIILSSVLKKGKKWSNISKKLETRTENQVKNRFKSLINKIHTDQDISETQAIEIYVKRNQSAVHSTKHGMIGKRGRHKAYKKSTKSDGANSPKISDVDDGEEEFIIDHDNDSFMSDHLSVQKKMKLQHNGQQMEQEKQPNNMKLRSQKKPLSYKFEQQFEQQQRQLQQQQQLKPLNFNFSGQIEQQSQQQFKDYQRDFSNYFSQLSQQHTNTEVKVDLLDQAIDQYRIQLSPQFQKIQRDNSGCNFYGQGQFTPTPDYNPFLNFDEKYNDLNINSISPFRFKQNNNYDPIINNKKNQQIDQTSEQIQQLMQQYQRQIQSCLIASQSPSAAFQQQNPQDQLLHYNLQSQFQNLNSALIGSAARFDYSPFGPRSAQRQEDQNAPIHIALHQDIQGQEESKIKKNDFLQVDNPIEKYNRRRNISQKD